MLNIGSSRDNNPNVRVFPSMGNETKRVKKEAGKSSQSGEKTEIREDNEGRRRRTNNGQQDGSTGSGAVPGVNKFRRNQSERRDSSE